MRIVLLQTALLLVSLTGCGLNVDDPYLDGPAVTLSEPPPPIAGGTLLVTRDARFAIAADPDRDRVVIVDLASRDVMELPVTPGLQPGRVAEDGSGRVYVALRRGDGLLELDPARGVEVARHPACAHPRGVAWESDTDSLHVACADGTLATLGATREIERTLFLAPDLRDVVITDAGLLVSRYRSAELVLVDRDGAIAPARQLPVVQLTGAETPSAVLTQDYAPHVAVRLVGTSGGALVLHQRARIGPEAVLAEATRPSAAYYSNEPVTNEDGVTWRDPCHNSVVVHAAATFVGPNGATVHQARPIERGVLPIDVAVSARGRVAVAFAAEPGGAYYYGPQIVELASTVAERDMQDDCLSSERDHRYPGQVVAVAFAGEQAVALLREPARLVIGDEVVELGGASVRDSGHDVFHLDTGGGVACASCHPEGGDDGHVWQFVGTSTRRTQPLEGMVGRVPYHRAGDVATFGDLMSALREQMASPPLEADALAAAESWLARLPPPPSGPVVDPEAVERGRALFVASDVGCESCHAGERGTDDLSHPIRGQTLQTPPLRGIALRAPYLFDGRVSRLRDAFVTSGGSPTHGMGYRDLSEPEIADLEAYVLSR